ncbi:MAG: hypothetical protein DRN92_04240 [Thermoproteota archaeon]|nr:MAG: hypothetical protein DRN92_04240 [Candidatus Korarchaeota archaeon]
MQNIAIIALTTRNDLNAFLIKLLKVAEIIHHIKFSFRRYAPILRGCFFIYDKPYPNYPEDRYG